MAHTTVRPHTRRTARGPVNVRQHGRRVSLADRLTAPGRRSGGEMTAAMSAVGLSAVLLIGWALSAVMSTAAALLCAVTTCALAFLGWQARPKDRNRKGRARPAALAYRRRRRLAWYRTRRRLGRWLKRRTRSLRQRAKRRQPTPVVPSQRERKAG